MFVHTSPRADATAACSDRCHDTDDVPQQLVPPNVNLSALLSCGMLSLPKRAQTTTTTDERREWDGDNLEG
jgi:hypothetical protein